MKSRTPKKSKAGRASRSGKATKPAKRKAARKGAPGRNIPANPSDPREKALALMKKGVSQTSAAKEVGITTQRLARYRLATTNSKLKDKKWWIKDRRPAEMHIASNAKQYPIAVPYRGKSTVGHYWNAINRFLVDNDIKELAPFSGRSIRDITGKKHVFETDPNTLRMMDAIGDLNFLQIYANTVN